MSIEILKNKEEKFGSNEWIIDEIKRLIYKNKDGYERLTGNYFTENISTAIQFLKEFGIEIDISIKYDKILTKK